MANEDKKIDKAVINNKLNQYGVSKRALISGVSVIACVVLIIVMLFRPQGLMGMKELSFVNGFFSLKSRFSKKAKNEVVDTKKNEGEAE